MRRLLAGLLLCSMLCGCLPFGQTKFESYHPVIKDLPSYPGGVTKQVFWAAREQWLQDIVAQDLTARERDILSKLFDTDTLYEEREAQIKKYNEWAKAQNAKSGYPEF
jgi:hypothetical protein